MEEDEITAREFLEIIAGEVCICGHKAIHHAKPDPNFKIGEFVQISGKCRYCDCMGEISIIGDDDE